eukprot:157554_1
MLVFLILLITNINKSVINIRRDGWTRTVHCSDIMKTGIHFIEFEINNFNGSYMCIGINDAKTGDIARYIGCDNNGYGWIAKQNGTGFLTRIADPYVNSNKPYPYNKWG